MIVRAALKRRPFLFSTAGPSMRSANARVVTTTHSCRRF